MKRIAAEEIQPLLLDIFKVFHAYCVEHELTYFMSDGTLLGAVRHKGFIPWDDDIDVSMIADQYDALIALAKEDAYLDADKRYKFLLPGEAPNFYPFIKVIDTKTISYEKDIERKYAIGLWLDVFRFSYCEADFQKTLDKFHKVLRLKELNKLAVCGNFRTTWYNLLYPVLLVGKGVLKLAGRTPYAFSSEMQAIEASLPNDGTRLMDITWADGDNHWFDASLWKEVTLLDFDDGSFMAPAKYDEVLTQQFGDYMQLPPVEQRVRHDFEAYFI